MRSLSILTAALVAAAASGCTYNAAVAPTSAPAAEVMPNRRLAVPVSQSFDPSMYGMSQNATTGFACSAHTFPVTIGEALVSTIRTANDAGFAKVIPADNPREPAPGAERHLFFQSEGFNVRLSFDQGFWTAHAVADAEVIFRVTGYDAQGNEILRALAAGNGNARSDVGGCEGGADALSQATGKAIQRAVENYVYKVINARQL